MRLSSLSSNSILLASDIALLMTDGGGADRCFPPVAARKHSWRQTSGCQHQMALRMNAPSHDGLFRRCVECDCVPEPGNRRDSVCFGPLMHGYMSAHSHTRCHSYRPSHGNFGRWPTPRWRKGSGAPSLRLSCMRRPVTSASARRCGVGTIGRTWSARSCKGPCVTGPTRARPLVVELQGEAHA